MLSDAKIKFKLMSQAQNVQLFNVKLNILRLKANQEDQQWF